MVQRAMAVSDAEGLRLQRADAQFLNLSYTRRHGQGRCLPCRPRHTRPHGCYSNRKGAGEPGSSAGSNRCSQWFLWPRTLAFRFRDIVVYFPDD